MSWLGVPAEVCQAVTDNFGNGWDIEQLHYFAKDTIGRGDAWNAVQAKCPTTIVRKCHTKDYWVWLDTRVENPHAKRAYEEKLARERAGSPS